MVRLLDREAECARIDSMLDRARSGRSGVLVLRGEPGIGKSSLLDYALERAEGLLVLTARGFESESEIAFAGLSDLLRPLLDRLTSIPEPQATALASALAVGPPAQADRFTICAATLSLLAAAAEDRGVLVTVDDAHWLDGSSTEAVLFAARRLKAEGVVMLIASRDLAPQRAELAALPQLMVQGLGRGAARELSTTVAGDLSAAAFERLYATTSGNPLALIEIPALLTDAQRTGEAHSTQPLPSGDYLEQALRRQVDLLPQRTRRALLVVAASDTGDLGVVTAALDRFNLDLDAVSAAETARVVHVTQTTIVFRHPLLRSVVYYDAPTPDRCLVHRALAEVLAGSADEQAGDLRAWHLGMAATAADEEAASALEVAGTRSCRRGGYLSAAHALERSARLTSPGPLRARRLLKAAKWWQLAGRGRRAGRLLDDALADALEDPVRRAEIQHLRGFVQMWRTAPPLAQTLLSKEAQRVVAHDAGRAVLMYADAAIPCFMTGEYPRAYEAARRAAALAEQVGGTPKLVATVVLAVAEGTRGHRQEARRLLDSVHGRLLASPALGRSQEMLLSAMAWIWLERYDRAEALLVSVTDWARSASALGVLPYALSLWSDLDFRRGRWASAYAGAAESVRLADETHQANSYGLYFLSRMEAVLGKERDCREHVERAVDVADHWGIAGLHNYTGNALALLDLGAGRVREAVDELERVRARVQQQGVGELSAIPWGPDLVEAYVRAGQRTEAEAELRELAQRAASDVQLWASGAVERCRGLLAPEGQAEEHFAAALDLHERLGAPFERGRTLLCAGERLRRGRHRLEAREPLTEALRVFEALGARPWAERARSELAATGLTAGRSRSSSVGELTPQELQIALSVAAGSTNQEAAGSLFLSRKTVEYHLSAVYRKTGVGSRHELGAWLAENGAV